RLAVASQLIDHANRLLDLLGQPLDTTDLRHHQAATADGFLVDALRAAHGGLGTGGDGLGGGRHLVHRRGHLLDLAALLGDRLVALAGNAFDPAGLALDLGDGLPDPLDQLADLRHGGVEDLAQFAQLVAALHRVAHGYVAGGDLVHDHA